MGKEIIILCDGTSNSPENGAPPTNIDTLKKMLGNGKKPVTSKTTDTGWDLSAYTLDKTRFVFYDRGLGSPTLNAQGQVQGWSWNVIKNMGVVYNKFFKEIREATVASGIIENVAQAYALLALNYKKSDDDQVYLFGFSRGAYTIRLLITLIRHIGLIQVDKLKIPSLNAKENETHIRNVIEHLIEEGFSTFDRHQHPDTNAAARSFRNRYCYTEQECQGLVRFLGLFDTVRGLVTESVHEDSKLTSVVKSARHALAIDERRPAFKPELWVPASATDSLQMWFAGVHSDVGGGYADRHLSNIALRWMIKEAFKSGLVIDKDTLTQYGVDPGVSSISENSTDSLGYLGVQHDSFNAKVTNDAPLTWHDVSLGAQYRRPILQTAQGESVHKSVSRRYGNIISIETSENKKQYTPANLSHTLTAARNARNTIGPFFALKVPDADELSDVGEDDSLVRKKSMAGIH